MVDLKIFREKAVKTKEAVTIDYPKEGESISSGYYSFRISASFKAAKTEVSINGSSWMPCRQAMGFWWYDWSSSGAKNYTLQARAYNAGGTAVISTVRNFKVPGAKS
jgi:hypothetical protein